jgi:hypothetical protein
MADYTEQKCNDCGHRGPLKDFVLKGQRAVKAGGTMFSIYTWCPKCKSGNFEPVKEDA